MEYIGETPSTLKGSTILIPAISTGWIAQATVDLLIKTYNIPRIGFFEDEAILPVVCVFSETGKIATALELFHEPKLNLTIIQYRSAPALVCFCYTMLFFYHNYFLLKRVTPLLLPIVYWNGYVHMNLKLFIFYQQVMLHLEFQSK